MDTKSDMESYVPIPVVSWYEVTSSADPAASPTRSRYRTLKSRGSSSQGVHVRKAVAGRATGSDTYHSVLTLLAQHALRDGHTEAATQLVKCADQIEANYSSEIVKFLAAHPVSDLPRASFYTRLLHDTSDAIQHVGWDADFVLRATIESFDGAYVSLREIHRGLTDVLRLNRRLADTWHLAVGDAVAVFQHLANTSAIIELLPLARERPATIDDAMLPKRDRTEIARLKSLTTTAAGRRTVALSL